MRARHDAPELLCSMLARPPLCVAPGTLTHSRRYQTAQPEGLTFHPDRLIRR
jgi:hypothetical protein